MIEKIIAEIKEAEDNAAQIIQNSRHEAKQMVLDAENSAAELKRETLQRLKAETKSVVRDAEDAASVERDKILEEGKKSAADLLEKTAKKVESAAQFVVDELLKKYGVQ